MNDDRSIPDKNYFKIGEAAAIVGVETHTIRYWESTFRGLKPAKTKSRQRLFRRRDVELLLLIRALLHDQRFTIEGAQHQLKAIQDAEIDLERVLALLGRDGAPALIVSALGAATMAAPTPPVDQPPTSPPETTSAPSELEAEKKARIAAERAAALWRLRYDRLAGRMRERWESVIGLAERR